MVILQQLPLIFALMVPPEKDETPLVAVMVPLKLLLLGKQLRLLPVLQALFQHQQLGCCFFQLL